MVSLSYVSPLRFSPTHVFWSLLPFCFGSSRFFLSAPLFSFPLLVLIFFGLKKYNFFVGLFDGLRLFCTNPKLHFRAFCFLFFVYCSLFCFVLVPFVSHLFSPLSLPFSGVHFFRTTSYQVLFKDLTVYAFHTKLSPMMLTLRVAQILYNHLFRLFLAGPPQCSSTFLSPFFFVCTSLLSLPLRCSHFCHLLPFFISFESHFISFGFNLFFFCFFSFATFPSLPLPVFFDGLRLPARTRSAS